MSERMDDDALDRYYTDGADDIVYDEAKRARASEAAKDKEIERLKADNAALRQGIARAIEQAGDAAEEDTCDCGGRQSTADHDTTCPLRHVARLILTPHPGAALLEELTRLRATIRDIGERLVAAGGTREGTILEQLNSILQRTDAKAP